MPPIDTLAGTDTEAPQDDLRGDIAALFEGDSAPAESTEGGTSEVTEPETVAAEPNNEGRVRNADGTFAPKQKTEAAPEVVAPVEKQPSTDTQTKASAVAATQPDAPPVGWTAEGKAAWSELAKALPTLPPVAQAAVRTMQMAALKREEVAAAGSQQWSADRQRYEGMISPIARLAQARGMSAEQGASLLVAAQESLDRNPADGIRRLAQSYGVDLATLAGQPADSSAQPDITALVRQAVAPFLNPIQERMAAEDRQREQSTVDFVTQFSTSPGHEHFEAVQSDIMDMIPSIKSRNPAWTHQQVLQEAYDRAVYANPQTRDSILSARDAQAETKRVEEAKQRADKARKAGTSVTGNPSGAPATQAKDSLRAEIEAAYSGG